MAKSSRGGKRNLGTIRVSSSSISSSSASSSSGGGNAQQAQQQTVQQATPTQTMSASYNQFASMTDDQKADVISTNIQKGVPAHLASNDFQKFIYNIGLNDKPQMVDDATLNSMSGKSIYRTVNSVYDRKNDISYNADQIVKQVQSGRITRVSDNGGSVYGRGLYFADNRSDSTAYGNTYGNVKKTAIVRAKLNSNAKVINYYTASSGVSQEIRSGSKLGKVLRRCDSASQVSIYAMAKGYNVISNGSTYLNILNRNAITISSSINPI